MRFSLAVCVLTIAAFLTIQASAQEIHADLCMYGCPSGSPPTNDIIIRDIYILSSNDSTKFADWVAYRVMKRPSARRRNEPGNRTLGLQMMKPWNQKITMVRLLH